MDILAQTKGSYKCKQCKNKVSEINIKTGFCLGCQLVLAREKIKKRKEEQNEKQRIADNSTKQQ